VDASGAAVSRATRRARLCLSIVAVAVFSSGHVGSPDTWFEGRAGPYPVRVVVRSPGVVPGLADVTIRVTGDGIRQVTARPIQAGAAEGAAPPPDVAKPVPGDPELYSVQLWLMAIGAYGIDIAVDGARGSGTVSVPVTAIATRRLEMTRPLSFALIASGVFLIGGLLTLVGASVRESVLAAGEVPDNRRKRRALIAMTSAGVVLALLVLGGWKWWQSEDAAFARYLNWTLASTASVEQVGGRQVLNLAITDSAWLMRNDAAWLRRQGSSGLSPLIPDHGKLMHMFVVREDKAAFAHLHPVPRDSTEFLVTLPALPAGTYLVYGDIVRENGISHTLVSAIDLPASAATTTRGPDKSQPADPDPDDAWWLSGPLGDRASLPTITLSDGSTMAWEREPSTVLEADREADLRFRIRAPDGSPAVLDPYMGMMSHAMVTRWDDSVFVHLHPFGSISMGTQRVIEMRSPTDTVRGMLGQRITASDSSGMGAMVHDADPAVQGVVSFPYAFPSPGKYRVWVQVKRDGTVLTGAFDAEVGAGR
jgi:hypothetical protein